MQRKVLASVVAGVCAGLLASSAALAGPYASGITTSAGNITFYLNEPADDVTLVRNGTPTSLGALGRGSHTFSLQGAGTYSIRATKTHFEGWQNVIDVNLSGGIPTGLLGVPNQTTDDANVLLQFDRPTGIAINDNPATPALFGRMYIAAPRVFTTGSGRPVADGIYVLNPDQTDTFGQGNTPLTAGLTFDSTSTGGASPWHLHLDRDGNLYIGDWSDSIGSVYRTAPDVTNGVNMFTGVGGTTPFQPTTSQNHGSTSGFAVRGSPTAGNLEIFTLEEDLSFDGTVNGVQGVWRFNLGSSTGSFNGLPTPGANPFLKVQGVQQAGEFGASGLFYGMQSRANGQETDVYVMSSDGSTVLYDSLADSVRLNQDGFPTGTGTLEGVQDALRAARNIAVDPKGRWLAVNTANGGDVWMVPLLGGLPDIVNRIRLDAFAGGTGDDVEFDAAGNVWAGNRSDELVRQFSPGGVSVTEWNSDGTFTYRNEPDFNGSGNYSDGSKWLLNLVPNAGDAFATVGNLSAGAQTLNIDTGGLQLSRLRLAGGNYTVSGGSIQMGAGFSEPRVIAEAGNHTITAPLAITKNMGYSVDTGATLAVTNPQYPAGGVLVTKWGGGVLTHPRVTEGQLFVRAGTFRLASGSGVSVLPNVEFASAQRYDYTGGSLTIVNETRGSVDLNNNALVLTSGDLTAVTALVASGRAGGAWNGPGYNSSLAAANSNAFAVGVARAGDLNITNFLGTPVLADHVLLRYTRVGDANLDGITNIGDFSLLGANFNQPGGWSKGDFNYDGSVNIGDFSLLASNFNQSAAAGALGRGGAVPEPATLGLVGVAAMGLIRRRRS